MKVFLLALMLVLTLSGCASCRPMFRPLFHGSPEIPKTVPMMLATLDGAVMQLNCWSYER